MYRIDEVPGAYRRFFFINAGGPTRRILRREVVARHWQLVTLDCGDQLLLPGYRKAVKVGCGFCGGLQPLSAEETMNHPGQQDEGDPDSETRLRLLRVGEGEAE
jgi:hypothetical protein